MNYEETIAFLYNQLPAFQRIGAAAYKANLDNTYALMKILGEPQLQFKSIHIAGTNGKGSTANMLASIYQEAGYKTALYTSPHLKDFRERIRLNGTMIPKEFVVDFVANFAVRFTPISPSFFELTMAMAFHYFAQQKVDIAIVETGMGGRLDSTNIIVPELSIITNIGFDHVQFLGDTLAKIAAEKAGIIKNKIPVLIGEKQTEIQSVFEKKAKEQAVPIYFAEEMIKVICLDKEASDFQISYQNEELFSIHHFPLRGSYQIKNLTTVMAAALLLKLPLDKIQKGIENVIKNTHFAGRWQILNTNPLTICDTGHNEDGLRFVVEQLAETPHHILHFVLGVVNDKDLDHILNIMPKEAIYYFCKADIPRGLEAETLQIKANKIGLIGAVYSSVNNALKAAQNAAKKDDLVFVGGSTFTVAEVV
jgi:dihydrofolate synthase/folylpolyglutamate synthase